MARVKLYDQGQLPSAAIDTIQAPNAPADLSGAQALEGIATAVDTVSKSAAAYLGDVQQQNAYNAYIKQREEQRISAAQMTLVRKLDADDKAIRAKTELNKFKSDLIQKAVQQPLDSAPVNDATDGMTASAGGVPTPNYLQNPELGVKAYDDYFSQIQQTYIDSHFANDPEGALLFTDKINNAREAGQSEVRNDLISAKTKRTVAQTKTTMLSAVSSISGTSVIEQGVVRPKRAIEAVSEFDGIAQEMQSAILMDQSLQVEAVKARADVAIDTMLFNLKNGNLDVVESDLLDPEVAKITGGQEYSKVRSSLMADVRRQKHELEIKNNREQANQYHDAVTAVNLDRAVGNKSSAQAVQDFTKIAKDTRFSPAQRQNASSMAVATKNAAEIERLRVEKGIQSEEYKVATLQNTEFKNRLKDEIQLTFNDLHGFDELVTKGSLDIGKTPKERSKLVRNPKLADPKAGLAKAQEVLAKVQILKAAGQTPTQAIARVETAAKKYLTTHGMTYVTKPGGVKRNLSELMHTSEIKMRGLVDEALFAKGKAFALFGEAPSKEQVQGINNLASKFLYPEVLAETARVTKNKMTGGQLSHQFMEQARRRAVQRAINAFAITQFGKPSVKSVKGTVIDTGTE